MARPTSHRPSASYSVALVGATRWAPVERVDVLKFEYASRMQAMLHRSSIRVLVVDLVDLSSTS